MRFLGDATVVGVGDVFATGVGSGEASLPVPGVPLGSASPSGADVVVGVVVGVAVGVGLVSGEGVVVGSAVGFAGALASVVDAAARAAGAGWNAKASLAVLKVNPPDGPPPAT